ncbi:diguanylate cyclase domain-containing protein [Paractinoplanes maris]|uniref:diguanylate cyclase domain-containing protein n=1 Tax=Paractinoplanes maris TaxID=1734446 RepID=UPI002020F0D6|nr:GGDEF domain-containing protein [Actinoplanes maris]
MRVGTAPRYALVGLAGLVLQLALPHLSLRAGLIVSSGPIAVAGWCACDGFRRQARTRRGRQRAGLILGAVAAALLGSAYVLYTVGAVVGDGTVLSNSVLNITADVLGILAASVTVPAILVAVPPFGHRLARATYAIDVITVAGAIFATAWQFVLAPTLVRLAPDDRAVFLVTMLPEIIAAALALMLMSRPGAGQYRSMRVMAAGMGTFALAALISVRNHTQDVPWYTGGLGAVYLIAGLTIALGSRTAVLPGDTAAAESPAGSWSTLPYFPVAVALASVGVAYGRSGTLSPVLVWSLLATVALAMFRQFLNLLVVRGLLADLHEQRRRLDRLAHHDTLTGLPNRSAFYDRAREALARAQRSDSTAVLLLDLDGFKQVNDTLGHAAGDALLIGVAERLSAALREGDTVARLGGDEFAVVVPGIAGPDDAVAVGHRILEQLTEPISIAGRQVRAYGSVGVTVADGPGHDLDCLLHEADLALYAAKAAGKGLVRRHQPPAADTLPAIS